MQTFLPYPDFGQTARCLDRQRLGKQRVECLQILRTLVGINDGWKNHPAVKMWSRNRGYLVLYGKEICSEWICRGYKDTCLDSICKLAQEHGTAWWWLTGAPHWLGDLEFHRSHKSNLLRKAPEWYSQFNWDVSDNLPYVWP